MANSDGGASIDQSSTPKEHRLTARSLIAGGAFGTFMCSVNTYLTLRFGIIEEFHIGNPVEAVVAAGRFVDDAEAARALRDKVVTPIWEPMRVANDPRAADLVNGRVARHLFDAVG